MMDLENFDIDAATQQAWDAFTANLGEVLSVMDDTSDLTISVARGLVEGDAAAIRFSAKGTSVLAVVNTGSALPGKAAVEDENTILVELGWHVPDEHVGSFHAKCDQEETEPLAALTAQTVQEVFDVLHPVFLEPDQLKEILRGDVSWPTAPPPERPEGVAVATLGRADLDRVVDAHLERIFGHPALRNPDGDVSIRVGSTMIFLRSTLDAEEVVLFAPLVHDVSGRSRACEVLNDLNVETRYGRFALHKDRVYVQVSVPAKPFVPGHLRQALRVISRIADAIDDELADKLGGRTTFPGP